MKSFCLRIVSSSSCPCHDDSCPLLHGYLPGESMAYMELGPFRITPIFHGRQSSYITWIIGASLLIQFRSIGWAL